MDVISRKEAIAAGLNRFFTGVPCVHGHVCLRSISQNVCLECGRLNGSKQHAKNRERNNLGRWKRAHDDIEAHRKRNRERYWANPEYYRAKNREYEKRTLEKRNANGRKKRARKAAALGSHTADDIRDIRRMQKNKCAYCRISLDRAAVHVDHIIPLSAGGANDRTNLQVTCAHCNLAKRTKHPIVYARSLGRLL